MGAAARAPALAHRARPTCAPHWVPAWSVAEADGSGRGFHDETIRQISQVQLGGDTIRLRLSNQFGTQPVTFDAVRAGLRPDRAPGDSPTVEPGSNVAVTFDGQPAVTLQPGTVRGSDPIPLAVDPFDTVVTSLYTATPTGPSTVHPEAQQISFVAGGNHAADESGGPFVPLPTPTDPPGDRYHFLTDIDVLATDDAGTIVALGDSITNGTASSPDRNNRYPDQLARRLAAVPWLDHLTVSNQGIGGNRILSDSLPLLHNGPSALNRLDRDVLSQPSVVGVIVLAGLNDIGQGEGSPTSSTAESHEIIAGLQQVVDRVRAAGLPAFVGTLTPAGDATEPSVPTYSIPTANQTRDEVNRWIRSSPGFDGVIDFDAALRSWTSLQQLADYYDSGDHLHPNDAGYWRAAHAVDLRLFEHLGSCPAPG